MEPVYHLVELPATALQGIRTYTRSYGTLVEENRRQGEALLGQAGAMQRLETLAEENRRLRELLQATRGQDYEFRFAELVQVKGLDQFAAPGLQNFHVWCLLFCKSVAVSFD